MTERSVTHATFAIERTYHAAPEQDAFLDGHDNAAQREEGCRGLLEALAVQLDRQVAA
jgi:hypothetical protein